MMTSRLDCMNVPYVQWTLLANPVCGLARYVGLYFTSSASTSGPITMKRRLCPCQRQMVNNFVDGVAQVAIFRIVSCRMDTRVGVKKNLTLPFCRVYLRIPAVRLVAGPGHDAHIHAILSAMPVLVRPAALWAQLNRASVADMSERIVVSILITILAGAVVRNVGNCCPVSSMSASDCVMMVCAVHVKKWCRRGAIAEEMNNRCSAARKTKK